MNPKVIQELQEMYHVRKVHRKSVNEILSFSHCIVTMATASHANKDIIKSIAVELKIRRKKIIQQNEKSNSL